MPSELPADFLTSFRAAVTTDRADIVKKHFKIEATLKADVSRSAKGGYEIRFEPLPSTDRLYFRFSVPFNG